MTATKEQSSYDDRPAGIEYHGSSGVTAASLEAIFRLLQTSTVSRARLLSSPANDPGSHGFLLVTEPEGYVAILPGFASGYGGEGPRGLSHALALLREFDVSIDELVLDAEVFRRLQGAALSYADVEMVSNARATTRGRVYDYVFEHHLGSASPNLWAAAEVAIPFPILHAEVRDLARGFWTDPDAALNRAFRRLEDAVRRRSGLTGHGTSLMSKAFLGGGARLSWGDLPDAETSGRAQRFTSAFMAYRNPRAHHEPGSTPRAELLREFLAVNELFVLLAEATEVPDKNDTSES